MSDEVRIRLRPRQHPEVWIREGERHRHFFTYFRDLATLLEPDNTVIHEPIVPWTATPVLPPRTLAYAQKQQESLIILEVPSGPVPVTLDTQPDKAFLVTMPRLLFGVKRHDNHVTQGFLQVVTTEDAITAETPLYHYPLPNYYSHSGLCWTPPEGTWPLDTIPGLIRTYFATPHNFHLANPMHNQPHYEVRELLEQWQAQDHCPHEWWVPTGTTFGQWWLRLAPPT